MKNTFISFDYGHDLGLKTIEKTAEKKQNANSILNYNYEIPGGIQNER